MRELNMGKCTFRNWRLCDNCTDSDHWYIYVIAGNLFLLNLQLQQTHAENVAGM